MSIRNCLYLRAAKFTTWHRCGVFGTWRSYNLQAAVRSDVAYVRWINDFTCKTTWEGCLLVLDEVGSTGSIGLRDKVGFLWLITNYDRQRCTFCFRVCERERERERQRERQSQRQRQRQRNREWECFSETLCSGGRCDWLTGCQSCVLPVTLSNSEILKYFSPHDFGKLAINVNSFAFNMFTLCDRIWEEFFCLIWCVILHGGSRPYMTASRYISLTNRFVINVQIIKYYLCLGICVSRPSPPTFSLEILPWLFAAVPGLLFAAAGFRDIRVFPGVFFTITVTLRRGKIEWRKTKGAGQ